MDMQIHFISFFYPEEPCNLQDNFQVTWKSMCKCTWDKSFF